MYRRSFCLVMLFVLVGCTFPTDLGGMFGGSPTQTPPPGMANTLAPTPNATAEPEPAETWDAIELWLPPQFDPNGSSNAAEILKNRLNAYQLESGVRVRVRIKSEAGPAGLLQSLSLTNAAAPQNLPSLVLLSRQDMETAALKGYLVALDGKSLLIDDPDWYPFTHQMAFIQGSQFGLPMAADTQIIVYRRAEVGNPPDSWDAITSRLDRIVFPAADFSALVTIATYLAAGGKLMDGQGRPQVEREPLERVLEYYDRSAKAGLFPANIAQYQTDANAWQAYQDKNADIAITWASRYLSQLPADSSAAAMPGIDDTTVSLGTAWMVTLTDPLVSRQPAAVALAEYLCDPTFLAEWTAAAGYLPTRPSALEKWSDQSQRTAINGIIQSSQAMPSNDVIFSLGPVLQDVVVQVIRQLGDPATSADEAVKRLLPPEVNQ